MTPEAAQSLEIARQHLAAADSVVALAHITSKHLWESERMKITKNGHNIRSVDEWFALAPPKKGQDHWVDGRSAKELAKAWFPTAGVISVPEEFSSLVNSSDAIGSVTLCEGEPEAIVHFDPFRGPRNCDLLAHPIHRIAGIR